MNEIPSKADWKLFQSMISELRERYLKTQNERLSQNLLNEAKTPTENFWEVEKEIREQAGILQDCLDGYSKSRLVEHVMFMKSQGMILEEDLHKFSPEFQAKIQSFFR